MNRGFFLLTHFFFHLTNVFFHLTQVPVPYFSTGLRLFSTWLMSFSAWLISSAHGSYSFSPDSFSFPRGLCSFPLQSIFFSTWIRFFFLSWVRFFRLDYVFLNETHFFSSLLMFFSIWLTDSGSFHSLVKSSFANQDPVRRKSDRDFFSWSGSVSASLLL